MEKELFDWNGWDMQAEAAFSFYEVVLKRDIGKLKAGQKFDSAYVDYQNGILEFYSYSDPDPTGYRASTVVATFKLSLNVS